MPGPLAPGNINLFSRPRVANPDRSVSTVRSMSMQDENGREVLIPTVEQHGRGILNDEDAWKQYLATGQHLGMFATPDDATRYAEALHNRFAAGQYDVPLATSRRDVKPSELEAALLKRWLGGSY